MKLLDGIEHAIAETLLNTQDPKERESLKAQLEFWQLARTITDRNGGEASIGFNHVFEGVSLLVGLLLFASRDEYHQEVLVELLKGSYKHKQQLEDLTNQKQHDNIQVLPKDLEEFLEALVLDSTETRH